MLTRTSRTMKLFIIFVLLTTSAIFVVNGQIFEGIFSARLDHFRPRNQQRVSFRYHVNADHYDSNNGPLYIYLKDYRDYSTRWIQSGLMVDIAQQTRAALLTFDYRYFGVNRPTETASLDDLEFLSVEQILADIADFVRFVRRDIGGENTPVILWGSGFGGALAAWARSRYSHIITAAWSSSGYIEPEVSSYGPFDYLKYTFGIGDEGHCEYMIRSTYNIIAYLVVNGAGEYLSERLNLCHTVDTTSEADIASLYELSVRAVNTYIDQFHFTGVRAFCAALDAVPEDPLGSLARWLRYVYGDGDCFDHSYDSMIEANSNITWGSAGTILGRRQWYYLQCTQIGSFLLADENTWIPGTITMDFHLQKCQDVFGEEFTLSDLERAFSSLLQEFDQAISNVVYTNGLLDPFRYFGRMYDETGAGSVVNMEFVSKSGDLTSQSLNDPESVYNGKAEIRRLILMWSNTTANVSP